MKGINRTGNLLVPNNNYCKFEEWIMPILDRLVDEQKSQVNIMLCLIHACMYNCITLQLVDIVISPEFG